jgi:hypothetical protein
MSDGKLVLDRAPKELQIYAARVMVKADRRLGRDSDPRIRAIAEWPVEEAADYGQP